jgi:hypothetical protein
MLDKGSVIKLDFKSYNYNVEIIDYTVCLINFLF